MASWLGMAPADARPFVDALRPEMEAVTIEHSDGRPRWRLVGEPTVPHPPPSTPTLRLLPQYDSYILGHRQRQRLVPPAAKARIALDPKGRLEPVVGVSVMLVDGVIGGLWRRKVTARRLHVTVEPTTDLTPSHLRLLDAEVERVAAFLGVPDTTLSWAAP